jgi:hypothetical protein
VDVIVSDFDGTLFKRNFGLIHENVAHLEDKALPVYIITYRALNQRYFIESELAKTNIDLAGILFAESLRQEAHKKILLAQHLLNKFNVVEALDNDLDAVLGYKSLGINARQV